MVHLQYLHCTVRYFGCPLMYFGCTLKSFIPARQTMFGAIRAGSTVAINHREQSACTAQACARDA